MEVRFKKLVDNATSPTKAYATDAGFDLTAIDVTVDSKGKVVCKTGVAVEIPVGYVGLLFPRSSISKKDLILSNCVGVIDSGYRGEVILKFTQTYSSMIYTQDDPDIYAPGEKVGQLIIMPIPEIEFVESDELSDSDRGTGGFGSSGK